jgi:cytochrome c-type biogenesis protein CcmH
MIGALIVAAMLLQGTGDSTLDARTREVASTLRCPACEDVSIEDSPADLARDMRRLVREQLAQGKTPAQVRAYFVDRYGQWVLLDPSMSRNTAALWVLPLFAVTAGGAGLVLVVRRWSRAGALAVARDAALAHEEYVAGARKLAFVDSDAGTLIADDLEADRLDGKITDADFERLRAADVRAGAKSEKSEKSEKSAKSEKSEKSEKSAQSAKSANLFDAKPAARGKHVHRGREVS